MPAPEYDTTDNFYHNGHWGQCLELVSHLCLYSDNILLVTGPSGIGKTCLKQALLNGWEDKFVFCDIKPIPSLNIEDIQQRINAGFKEALDNQNKELVLLLDDAQEFAPEILDFILQQKQLHLVLFALPEFAAKMSATAQTIELEALTLAEVEEFLLHEWRLAGNTGDLPINKSTLKKIYASSHGIPGEVKQLFKTMTADKDTHKFSAKSSSLSPFTVGLIVCFGFFFCLLAFLWPSVDNKMSTPNTIAPIAAEEPIINTATTADNAVVSANDEIIARLEAKLLALQEQLIQEQEAKRNLEQQLLLVNKKSEPEPESAPESQPKISKKTSVSVYSKAEKNILESPSKNYTLQLIGSSDEKKIKDFIAVNKLSSKANYFKSIYQGKPWYIVIYGNYPTRSAANTALQSLPNSLKKLQPWPREYRSIQRTIKKQ